MRNPKWKPVQVYIDKTDVEVLDEEVQRLGMTRSALLAGAISHLTDEFRDYQDTDIESGNLATILKKATTIDKKRRAR